MRSIRRFVCLWLCLSLVAGGCGFYEVTPKEIDPSQIGSSSPPEVTTPTKVHLKDGGVVLFPDGFRVEGNRLVGTGERYDLTRTSRAQVKEVQVEDAAALEHYEKDLRVVESAATSVPVVVVGFFGALFLFKAIFGSCPTVYSLEGEPRLEAELFSHSISRRFEGNDFDRLSEVVHRDGGYRLRVANEAPETHYINSLALETVDHPAGTRVFPSPDGRIVVFAGDAPYTSLSRRGDDPTSLLAAADGVPYRSDRSLVSDLAESVTEDWIELTVPVPAEERGKPTVLALRLRNTLMATVLLYDVMLKAQGINALDWLGEETRNPLYAWRLYRWFERNYGLRVEYWDGERFLPVESLSPTGPIAWHDVAVVLPPAAGPEVRIRVSFLPDNWMVDWAGVGFGIPGLPMVRSIAASGVDGLPEAAAEGTLAPLRSQDGSYLVTSPGESHTLFFPADPPAPGTERTCFLRSSGFYIEWLREDWFKDAMKVTNGPPFEPGDAAVRRTARLWLDKKGEMERMFLETRIPLAGGGR